jgi:glucosamine--fructose-6-phosphate aminotransferase (isomerizing)
MQKEIFEQPRAVGDTLQDIETITPELFGDGAYRIFKDTGSLLILACGTSYYAGLTAKYWIESLAKIPVAVEIASEYRYRDSVPDPRTLVVTISQSGETADTLAALKHARGLGMSNTLTICNVATSAMVRECKLNFITRAGVEIGVASTKAFTTQLTALFMLALALAQTHGRLTDEEETEHVKALRHLPAAIGSVLALEPQIMAWADRFATKENALFLGRGMHYPIALEGALKLKEISYIHAEAYPAGELKHGPLALVTEQMPVVTIAPNDALLEKLKSNMQEVRARGGELYVFADSDSKIVSGDGTLVIRMPEHYGRLSPILHTIPLQLLAYHTACVRGTDVDKPRNLEERDGGIGWLAGRDCLLYAGGDGDAVGHSARTRVGRLSKLATLPANAAKAAIAKPQCTELGDGSSSNIKLINRLPSVNPVSRAVPCAPPAAPLRSLGAESSMFWLFGV